MRMVMVLAVCLACAGAGPATKPATTQSARFRDFGAVLKMCPSERLPARGEEWKGIHYGMLNEWLRSGAVVDQKFAGPLPFRSAAVRSRDAAASFEAKAFEFQGIAISPVTIAATFAKDDAPALAKLKRGQDVRVAGVIDVIELRRRSKERAELVIRLRDCELVK